MSLQKRLIASPGVPATPGVDSDRRAKEPRAEEAEYSLYCRWFWQVQVYQVQAETKVATPAGLARSASNSPGEIHLRETAKVPGPAFAGDENPAAGTLSNDLEAMVAGCARRPLMALFWTAPVVAYFALPRQGFSSKYFSRKRVC
jgi:hypothetical protein